MVAAILRQVVRLEDVESERAVLLNALREHIGRALQEGRFSFADHFCDKLLAEDPRNLEGWLVKGHLAWRQFGSPETALACFRRVLILGEFESSNEYVAQARSSLSRLLAQLS